MRVSVGMGASSQTVDDNGNMIWNYGAFSITMSGHRRVNTIVAWLLFLHLTALAFDNREFLTVLYDVSASKRRRPDESSVSSNVEHQVQQKS